MPQISGSQDVYHHFIDDEDVSWLFRADPVLARAPDSRPASFGSVENLG